MTPTVRCLPALLAAAVALTGCTTAVQGTPTWPGERLERVLLSAADFPPGVQFDRIIENPGQPDGAGAPPAMLSDPPGCSDGFTKVITDSAERGAGSAAKYTVTYDGARMLVTVLSWPLDMAGLEATAQRCARFATYFDRDAAPIPMTTQRLDTPRPDALVYEQTMELAGARNSVWFSFENVDSMAVFAIAFPTPNPAITVKATLPQTFLDVTGKQAQRLAAP